MASEGVIPPKSAALLTDIVCGAKNLVLMHDMTMLHSFLGNAAKKDEKFVRQAGSWRENKEEGRRTHF